MRITVLPAVLMVCSAILLSGCLKSGSSSSSNKDSDSSIVSKINDTGVTLCGNSGSSSSSNKLNCSDVGATQTTTGTDGNNQPVPAGQDATFGRDALAAEGRLNKIGAGEAGFDFTKLDANGNELEESASLWSCVRDNVTGLAWEVKQSSGFHAAENTYGWHQTTNNNGYAGYSEEEIYNCGVGGKPCSTSKFIQQVNSSGLCGYSDWRMPSVKELQSIVHRGQVKPAIDVGYFPLIKSGGSPMPFYWTSTSSAYDKKEVWRVSFDQGQAATTGKGGLHHLMLVRGAK